MIYKEDGAFLNWIANRMVYSFGDDPSSWHIGYLRQLIDRIFNCKITISDTKLDNIIAKYYTDFFLEKTDTLGFDDDERDRLRHTMRNMCQDILSNKTTEPAIGNQNAITS